ncbi:MAG TPA: glycosyltransferase family 2 protein [Candidatus Paceibacterota bacterium]
MTPPSLSVIVPARNEKKYIELVVKRLLAVSLPENTEVLFVEGHSTDGTLDEIKRVAESYKDKINVRYAVQDNIGKADAVWKGFSLVQNDIVMILDADLTVEPEVLPEFYEVVKFSPDIFVNGSRLVYPMEKGAMRPLNYLGNKFFALLLSFVAGQKMSDTLCGTKGIYKSRFEAIKTAGLIEKLEDPFCDFTLLLGASYLGLNIVEVPIEYKKRIYGLTKIRRFKDGWRLLKIAIKYLFLPKHASRKI